jgi:hypothetical protein
MVESPEPPHYLSRLLSPCLVNSKLPVQSRKIEVIARGRGIRELGDLQKRDGGRVWRKMKGKATIRLRDGNLYRAELHWL